MHTLFSRLGAYIWPALCGVLIALVILQHAPERFGFPAAWQEDQRPAGARLASYADAVERATPSVVNIYTRKRGIEQASAGSPERRLYPQRDERRRQRQQSSLGSGVIVDRRGYILTNHHVIADADEILVSLHDQRESLAEVVGADPETDLAVLRIALDDIEALPLGAPRDVRVGDVVLAIGNPFGFGQTVTQGIVSATGRWGLYLNTYENYLQTDADINPGNSGGALINADGELLGINTALFSRSGGSQGIGLAIPVDIAAEVLESIILHGHVIRGWLGVETREISPGSAVQLGLPARRAVLISGIYRDGPAHRAGLKEWDLITHINGAPLLDGRSGLMQVSRMLPGETARISVLRGDAALSLDVLVGERPPPPT